MVVRSSDSKVSVLNALALAVELVAFSDGVGQVLNGVAFGQLQMHRCHLQRVDVGDGGLRCIRARVNTVPTELILPRDVSARESRLRDTTGRWLFFERCQ